MTCWLGYGRDGLGGLVASENEKLLEVLGCSPHPVAVVPVEIDLATGRPDLGMAGKLAWGLFGRILWAPFPHVLTGGDLW